MAETILLQINVDAAKAEQNIEKATKSIEELKKENIQLAAQQKKLISFGKESSKTYRDNAQAIALNRSSLTSLNKSRTQAIKALGTESNSIDALRMKLSAETAERNRINTATTKGTQRFNELNKSILQTSNRLSKAEQAGGDYRRSVGNYGKAMKGATKIASALGLVLGAGALFQGLKSSIAKFEEQANAEKRLEEAVGGNINAFKEQASALQTVTTFGDEATLSAQAQLKTLGLTEEQVLRLTPLVLDLSARSGKDLNRSTKEVVSSLSTGSSTLEKYGVELETTASLTENFDKAVQGLEKSVGGTAEATAKVGTGPLKQFQNRIGDIQESIGEKLVPILNFLAQNFETIATVLGIAAAAFVLFKIVTQASAVATKIADAATKAFNATMSASPLGIFLAIAATLAATFFGLSGELEAAEDRLDDFNDTTRDSIKLSDERIGQINREIKELKRQGAAEGVIIKARLKLNDEQIKRQQELVDATKRQREEISEGLKDFAFLGDPSEISKEAAGVQAELNKLAKLREDQKDLNAELNKEETDSVKDQNKASLEDIANFIKIRLTRTEEGSKEELKLKKQLVIALRNVELDAEKLTGSERALIRAEANQDLLELDTKFKEDEEKQLADNENKGLAAAKTASEKRRQQKQRALDKELDQQRKFATTEANNRKSELAELLASEDLTDEQKLFAKERFAQEEQSALIVNLMEQIRIRNSFGEDTLELETQLINEQLKIQQLGFEKEKNAKDKANAKAAKDAEQSAEDRKTAAIASFDVLADIVGNFTAVLAESAQVDLDNFTKDQDRKTVVLEEQLDNGIISQAEFDAEQEKMAKRKLKLEEKAFNRKKTADIASALINTAQSALGAFRSLIETPFIGPIIAPIAAGAATAFGLARVANIKKQKFAKGGKAITAGGKPHSQGGTTYTGEDGNAFEVERGENMYVLNRSASASINGLSSLNQAHGGRSFSSPSVTFAQEGGRIATNQSSGVSSSDIQFQQSLLGSLGDLKNPTVSVVDINSGTNRVAISENRANL